MSKVEETSLVASHEKINNGLIIWISLSWIGLLINVDKGFEVVGKFTKLFIDGMVSLYRIVE